MRTLSSLGEIRDLVIELRAQGKAPYIRFSLGFEVDARRGYSIDHQTGTRHAGLSAEALFDVHAAYDDGDPEFLLMQVTSYSYLMMQGLEGTHAWICAGREVGRDTDNAPVITDVEPIARVDDEVIFEATRRKLEISDIEAVIRRRPYAPEALALREQIAQLRKEAFAE